MEQVHQISPIKIRQSTDLPQKIKSNRNAKWIPNTKTALIASGSLLTLGGLYLASQYFRQQPKISEIVREQNNSGLTTSSESFIDFRMVINAIAWGTFFSILGWASSKNCIKASKQPINTYDNVKSGFIENSPNPVSKDILHQNVNSGFDTQTPSPTNDNPPNVNCASGRHSLEEQDMEVKNSTPNKDSTAPTYLTVPYLDLDVVIESSLLTDELPLKKVQHELMPKIVSVIRSYKPDLQSFRIYNLNNFYAEIESKGSVLQVNYNKIDYQKIAEIYQFDKSSPANGNTLALSLYNPSLNFPTPEIITKPLIDMDLTSFQIKGLGIEMIDKKGEKLVFTNTSNEKEDKIYIIKGLDAEMRLWGGTSGFYLQIEGLKSLTKNGLGRHLIDIACHYALCNHKKIIFLESVYGSWPFYFTLGLRPRTNGTMNIDNEMSDKMLVWYAKISGLLSDEEMKMLSDLNKRSKEDKDPHQDNDRVFVKTWNEAEAASNRNYNKIYQDKYPTFEMGTIVSPVQTKLVLESNGYRRNDGINIGMILDEKTLLEWQRRSTGTELSRGSLIYELGREKLASDLADLRRRLKILNERYFGNKYKI